MKIAIPVCNGHVSTVFEAADELGFYLYAECPAWGDVDDPGLARFIHEEGDRILQAYGNHPSFCLLSYGNEPGGKNQKQWLGAWGNHWKSIGPTSVVESLKHFDNVSFHSDRSLTIVRARCHPCAAVGVAARCQFTDSLNALVRNSLDFAWRQAS
mgnify:CR=1 FL=1